MAKWDLSKLPEGRKRMSNDLRSLNSLEDIEFAVKRIEELEAKLADAQWLLCDAAVQLREGLIKTRRNRADLIDTFLAELKGEKDE
jgi:hypothetical protein